MKNLWNVFLLGTILVGFNGCSLIKTISKKPTLIPLWEVSGLKGPESAVYDASRNVIYISNVNGAPTEKNGAGFISKISIDGQVKTLKWVTGLNAPKGLAVRDDILYISDLDSLVEVNVETGGVIKRHPVTNPMFLNDVAVDQSGNVYLSDMAANKIYRLSSGKLDLWVHNDDLGFPNGIYVEGDQLIVASWGVITNPETFGTDVPGHIRQISLKNKQVTSMGNKTPIGNLDGIEADGAGDYFVSDWVAGKIYHVTPTARVNTVLTLKKGSADIGFIKEKNILLVPMMMDGKLLAYSIK